MNSKLNIRFYRSVQFWVGLILAAVAAVGVLFAANLFNPPPTEVVIAVQEIPAFTTLDSSLFGVDRQVLDPRVAVRYVTRRELDAYLGAVTVEPIHVGDPLAKARLAVGEDAERLRKLSAAVLDPEAVIRVIPVSPDTCPEEVTAGDLVELSVTMEGPEHDWLTTLTNTQQLAAAAGGSGQSGYGFNQPPAAATPLPGEWLEMPVAKVFLRPAPVLRVAFKQIPNPNYGAGFGDEVQQQEPMFLQGDIERIAVLVDEGDVELLDYALANGTVRVGVRSALYAPYYEELLDRGESISPTLGLTWDDWQDWFFSQRLTSTLTTTLPFGGAP